ncbi:rCG41336, isoform CRA_a [Rattus norvegicus]|uniref:RCG41336, isoform CRA_a n=1 Tax=Rattus norvegicus TaxID=10116 RepID=A6IHQ0_RAT|nr:rCG41336, isoform CRA_a [Rattus norvegicus]
MVPTQELRSDTDIHTLSDTPIPLSCHTICTYMVLHICINYRTKKSVMEKGDG